MTSYDVNSDFLELSAEPPAHKYAARHKYDGPGHQVRRGGSPRRRCSFNSPEVPRLAGLNLQSRVYEFGQDLILMHWPTALKRKVGRPLGFALFVWNIVILIGVRPTKEVRRGEQRKTNLNLSMFGSPPQAPENLPGPHPPFHRRITEVNTD